MSPGLRRGDWVLVDPQAYRRQRPSVGEIAVVPDPRAPERRLVKRVESVDEDGRLTLAGDDPERSTDSRTFGPVDPETVLGRAWARYWPLRRVGRIR